MDCIDNKCQYPHSINDGEYVGDFPELCKSGAVDLDGYCWTAEYYGYDSIKDDKYTIECDVNQYT